jgi:hypothetical protein
VPGREGEDRDKGGSDYSCKQTMEAKEGRKAQERANELTPANW